MSPRKERRRLGSNSLGMPGNAAKWELWLRLVGTRFLLLHGPQETGLTLVGGKSRSCDSSDLKLPFPLGYLLKNKDPTHQIQQRSTKLSHALFRNTSTVFLRLAWKMAGMSVSITGPTLLDVQKLVNTDIQHITIIYTARSIGYLIGSLSGYECLHHWTYFTGCAKPSQH
ncbi:hypothetical protein TNCT_731681 [Trichonephila clavata]|uniref:Uncharacterized protein n=1 Tax=Trichonephila clavata TaxID=2740835 RepID=A0A8X6FK01_TRICU|nr:hypothetical protein TNCT_731681 [Trichonephila clavata]